MADKKRTILSIEAIRGIAAIYVMLGHIVQLYQIYSYFPDFDFLIKTIFGYGHQAVLLFFIVSGFSITYSSSNLNLADKVSLRDYFFKRFRRIYPLFFIVLLFSILILWITDTPSDTKRNILSFLFLTDNASGSIADPIPTNYPIWSLSYEVIYYLLFPSLLFVWNKIGLKRTSLIILGISIATGILGFVGWPNHLFNVLQYYWIWIAGAIMADAYIKQTKFRFDYLNGSLIASLGLMLTIEKIPIVSFWFWSLFFLLIFAGYFIKNGSNKTGNKVINFIIGFGTLAGCYLLTYNDLIVFHSALLRYIIPLIGVLLVILIFIPQNIILNIARFFLKPFVRAGSFSYALYIIHWPLILLFVFLSETYLHVTFISMTLIIGINIIAAILIAWFLEEKLQPVMAKKLNMIYYKKRF